MKKFLQIVKAIMICQAAGAIGALFTYQSVQTWYPHLHKSFLNPPGWVFGPVWSILYTLMGISLYYAWQNKKKVDLTWFWVQLGLNTLWSIIFFGLLNPWLAFFEIVFLWIAILMTIKSFWKPVRKAAYLLFPYLAWVTFASFLNLSVALLN